jgi:hypothetical protein
MASYTMMLQDYIEQATQDTDTMTTRDRIEAGRSKLFDFDYPLFDLNYKKVFETHFIRTFYMREIGFETEGLFKFKLENWLSINMPYYNKLFESELIAFDPLVNTKLVTDKNVQNDRTQKQTSDSSGSSNQTNSGSATETDFGRHMKSDNPDTRLEITTNDGSGVIEYASSIDEGTQNNSKTSTSTSNDTTSVNSTGNSTVNDTLDYLENLTGKSGDQTYSKMILEYRQTFLRIEKEIFNEMNELFMLVY